MPCASPWQFASKTDKPLVEIQVADEWSRPEQAIVRYKMATVFHRSSWDWIGLYRVRGCAVAGAECQRGRVWGPPVGAPGLSAGSFPGCCLGMQGEGVAGGVRGSRSRWLGDGKQAGRCPLEVEMEGAGSTGLLPP